MKTEDRDQELPEGAKLITEWVQVPYFPNGVVAGYPTDPGDWAGETVSIPKMYYEDQLFVTIVHGESMRDFDFREGDELYVRHQDTAESGDIVIARLDYGNTVKVYYEGEDGQKWLLPGNDNFSPIRLESSSDPRIQGVVRRIVHVLPRVGPKTCADIIRSRELAQGNQLMSSFPLLTPQAQKAGIEVYVMQELSRAAEGTSRHLMDVLYQQALVGNINYSKLSSIELHKLLKDYLNIKHSYESLRKFRKDVN